MVHRPYHSLLTLGTVIGKLTEPHHSTAHIPYRDSKLTRLLQPALSGNSRVAVVCTISPDIEQATETLSTLKFAKRAKMVVTKAERGLVSQGIPQPLGLMSLTNGFYLSSAAYGSDDAQAIRCPSGETSRPDQKCRRRKHSSRARSCCSPSG